MDSKKELNNFLMKQYRKIFPPKKNSYKHDMNRVGMER